MLSLEAVDGVIENILIKLLSSQDLFKCLKYDSSDALSKSNLTDDEKARLFDQDTKNKDDIRILFTPFNLEPSNVTRSEMRIFVSELKPDNVQIANVNIYIDIFVNNQIWRMDNGRIRPLVIVGEVIKHLQDVDLGFVGNMYFNTPIRIIQPNTHFSGYRLIPSVRSV